jgi:hypothetical protein
MVAYPVAVLDKLLSPISVPMRESTVYLHNKLGKQNKFFSGSAVTSIRAYFIR